MLDPASWLSEAEATPVGTKRRVNHDCGDGRTLIVNHEPTKYSAYCFRCGEAGFKPKQPTLEEMVAVRARSSNDHALRNEATLPVPMDTSPREWPREARLWLYKAALHDDLIKSLGIYYHAPTQRVVLPVIEDGTVTYWQARAVMKGQQPKYINPQVDRDRVLPRFGSGNIIVLTEDYLSAVRVGQVAEGWSLLGTNLKRPVLSRLLADGRPVAVWLDPDLAGRKASAKITRELKGLGVDVRNVDSARDPKLLPKSEIIKCLQL